MPTITPQHPPERLRKAPAMQRHPNRRPGHAQSPASALPRLAVASCAALRLPVVLAALGLTACVLLPLTAVADPGLKGFSPAIVVPSALAPIQPSPALSPSARLLQMPLQQAGKTSLGMIEVFHLSLRELLPEHRKTWVQFFRPFLVAGKIDLQVPTGDTYGVSVPTAGRGVALHVGGGTDLQINKKWRMSAHYAEMIHSGNLSQANTQHYRLSFRYAF